MLALNMRRKCASVKIKTSQSKWESIIDKNEKITENEQSMREELAELKRQNKIQKEKLELAENTNKTRLEQVKNMEKILTSGKSGREQKNLFEVSEI